jgi:taurine dioxygenase
MEELVGAFDVYQLLLFRNDRPIPPDRHVEIARWFGSEIDMSGGSPWGTMDNEYAAGRGPLAFHSDHTYTDYPIKVLSLHALELPSSGSSTSFVSGVYAWAALPTDLQERLAAATIRHQLRSEMNPSWPEFRAEHPARFVHPRTGHPVLFVTESHAKAVSGLEATESETLLSHLFDCLYAPDRVYTHEWEPFDFVIWDNLAVQHARTAEADPAHGRRLLQRVALNEFSLQELIDRAWQQQRSQEPLGA